MVSDGGDAGCVGPGKRAKFWTNWKAPGTGGVNEVAPGRWRVSEEGDDGDGNEGDGLGMSLPRSGSRAMSSGADERRDGENEAEDDVVEVHDYCPIQFR